MDFNWLLFIFIGFISGGLAGLLGIGGGIVLVSSLQAIGFSYSEAIATSSLAIIITSFAGSYQIVLMGYLNIKKVITLAFPAMIASLIGTTLVSIIAEKILQFCFGLLLLINIYLTYLKQSKLPQNNDQKKIKINQNLAILFTGS